MSYVVLARKWRPMQFDDVVSQNHVTTTLKNAITNERLASAYLFTGPRGVGKTTTARIFAKAINCEKGPTPAPCNECSSCSEITGSRSLDVFEIDGASNRGIDEVRNLRENLKYAASKGKHKIYIIDEVHMLTTEAFNALLKTLEEPPPRVLFIFATTEPHKVPATILSRCQRYDFHRIPLAEIVAQLQKICSEENIEIDEQSLYVIARKSEGSLRDSQSLLDQVVSFCGEKIKYEELVELLGIIDQDFFFETTEHISAKSVSGVLRLVEKIFEHGYDMAEFLNGLTEHFRNLLVIKATQDASHLEGLETYAQKYQQAGESFSESDLLRLLQLTSDSIYRIKQSSNPKLVLEMLLVKMAKMDKSIELEKLLTHIDAAKDSSAGSSPSQDMSSVTTQAVRESASLQVKQIKTVMYERDKSQNETPKANGNGNGHGHGASADAMASAHIDPAVALEKVKTEWAGIIDNVKEKKIHLGSFLNEGFPTRVCDGTLEISFGKENGFHINVINQNKKIIQEIITQRSGIFLNVNCKKNDTSEFRQLLEQKRVTVESVKPEKTADDEETMQIPILKKVIEVFDGEIIKVSE